MCGIVGYAGDKKASPLILEGLKSLEYRGYDSAGIAYFEGGKKLNTVKAVGKIKELEKQISQKNISSTIAIGHTRWATHGKPTKTNCHPHTDAAGEIAVVHNGIIENFAQIKESLSKKGYKFSSDTDTEVVAHLIRYNLKSSKRTDTAAMLAALKKTIKEIKGAFALGIVYAGLPGELFAVRRQSPLVIGLGKGENFLSSDVNSFLKYTGKAVFLHDDEIALVRAGGVVFYDKNGKIKKPEIASISWDPAKADKGGYEHYMLKEIHEQPAALADTLTFNGGDSFSAFGLDKKIAAKIKNIQIIACGTAYHASLIGKYFIETYADIPVMVETASEYKYRHIPKFENSLVITVSQSGETADTIAALKKAKEGKVRTLSICNVRGATLTRMSDSTFYTRCGREVSVASTKAFTSQLAALYAFALSLGRLKGSLSAAKFALLKKDMQKLPALMEETLNCGEIIEKTALKIYKQHAFIFLGRRACFPLALEGALKLKEISYKNAEGFPAGEIKHGPIAMISKGTPVIVILPDDDLADKMLSSCQEVKARGGYIIAVTQRGMEAKLASVADIAVPLPKGDSFLFTIYAAAALQYFAYYIAKKLGADIDQPRNLAKSVTVE